MTSARDANDYVEIARFVRGLGEDAPDDAATRFFLRELRPDGGSTLEKLLRGDALEPIVLVAPSGAGKSSELRKLAKKLRASGRPAAFAEATSVLHPHEMDLDSEERAAVASLRATERPGVLIVDALDELHIRNHTLEELFRRLAREVDFGAHPTRLVFSARNGAWSAASTRELRRLVARLGVANVELVTFEPLDLSAIRALGEASGIKDVEAFLEEFQSEEIGDLLDLRPMDVRVLARMHASGERLDRWSELLSRYVDSVLVEERPDRARAQRLSVEAGRRGLERVAAATMLMRMPHVSAPTVAMLEGAVSSSRLLADWPPAELSELFETALFIHKGRDAEAVQLPQGPLSHFLAASWLSKRVRLGLPIDELRSVLLAKVPGEERYEVPPSRSRIVGWVASGVPELRKLIASERPDLVLYGGDPDRLSDVEVRVSLRQLCDAIAAGRWDGWPTPATARRVARATVEADVRALLDHFMFAPKVTQQLLKLVEHGRYASCCDLALAFAAWSPDVLVRAFAVGAHAAAAPSRRADLLNLRDDPDGYVRLALLRALVPDVLAGAPLVAFLLAGGGHPVRSGLGEVAHEISTADLDGILTALVPLLSSTTVSADTRDAFEVAVPVLLARLERGGDAQQSAIEALAAIERLEHDHVSMNLGRSDEQALDRLLKRNETVRRRLWERRFAAADASDHAFDLLMRPRFGDVDSTDVAWLWQLSRKRATNGYNHPRFVLERLWSGAALTDRESLLATTTDPELAAYLTSQVARADEFAAKREAQVAREREKDARSRAENESALAERRSIIESGDDLDALLWGWKHLEGPGIEDARVSPERLRRYVGDEYVAVFLNGLRAAWRKIEPPVPTPGEGKPLRYLLGLTGVGLTVRGGLDVATLSAQEATRAARFGLYELNAFPFWYADLARSHPSEVRAALRDALCREWAHPTEHHGVLRFADRSDAEVSRIMRGIVLELLEDAPPAHARTLEYAVDALLSSTADRPRALHLLRRELQRAGSSMPEAHWLRLWAHTEPEAAADWLSARMAAEPDIAMPSLLTVATLLERDLDERFGRTAATSLMAPRALARWATLLLSFVKPSEDARHEGAYSPGERDHAEDLRNRCLTRLAEIPTPEATAVLREMLADNALTDARPMLDFLIKRQHALVIEASVPRWTEEDVRRLELNDEKLPRTLNELFTLVKAHIRHVHDLIANDDFSYRDLFKPRGSDREPTHERELQLWVASSLRQRARGLYSVVRENVVDDNKEVDISAFVPGVGHVPIEIKPLGDYSATELEKIVDTQLLGQYMQPPDRKYGVLLLVRRDERRWRLGNELVAFEVLLEHLRGHVTTIGARHGKEVSVAVVDLLAVPAATSRRLAVQPSAVEATTDTKKTAARRADRKPSSTKKGTAPKTERVRSNAQRKVVATSTKVRAR